MKRVWSEFIRNNAGYNYHIPIAWLKICAVTNKSQLMAQKRIQIKEVSYLEETDAFSQESTQYYDHSFMC